MTPAAILAGEIARAGPIPFHRFMEVALYDPEHGYYRRARDPFGNRGDYYTAEQIQPVFGILISSYLRSLLRDDGMNGPLMLVELGPGRREMAEFFTDWQYVPVEAGDQMPDGIRGAVFANEFFDALPVDVVARRNSGYRHMRVGFRDEQFHWVISEPVEREVADYLERYAAPAEDGALLEVNLEALRWIETIAARLERGYLLVIDYGYTAAEIARFPAGTLMSYRRHMALEDVLTDPGDRDITAHVCFTALEQHAAACGFESVRFESMGRMLLRTGESDQFAPALGGETETERRRRRLQLKSLMFGMGESFLTLLLRKAR